MRRICGPDFARYYSNGVALVSASSATTASYTVAPPTGVTATDEASLSAALASGETVIQLGIGTYEFDTALTGSVAGKTIRGYGRALTTLKLANGHALDHLFVPTDSVATDTIFEDFTFDGNASNSATTSNFCGLLKAETIANLSERFKLRRCTLKNGRSDVVRILGNDIEYEYNLFDNWEDVVFSVYYSGLKFHHNTCTNYGTSPYQASDTGAFIQFIGDPLGTGPANGEITNNHFDPNKRGAETFTVTIASPAVFTLTGHGFRADQKVRMGTTGALPTGLSGTWSTQYYVISTGLTTDTFQLSASQGGAAINTSGGQSGVHSLITGTGQFAIESAGSVGIYAYNIRVSDNTFDARNTNTTGFPMTGISGAFAYSVFSNNTHFRYGV